MNKRKLDSDKEMLPKRISTSRSTTIAVLHWFRTDLRLVDNIALSQAAAAAAEGGGQLFTLFLVTPSDWARHDCSASKLDFWYRNLILLHKELDTLNVPLVVRPVKHHSNIPAVVSRVVQELGITRVFWNKEYEVHEMARDLKTRKRLEKLRVAVTEEHDQCIIPPGLVQSGQQRPYTVFTPFKKAWIVQALARPDLVQPRLAPTHKNPSSIRQEYAHLFKGGDIGWISSEWMEKEGGWWRLPPGQLEKIQKLFPAGEKEASSRLSEFLVKKGAAYKEMRDFPCQDGTSVLSPYLTSGVISARVVLGQALTFTGGSYGGGSSDGGAKKGWLHFISELIWREFYRHVLYHFPRVSKGQPFRLDTMGMAWQTEGFEQWCQGRTGYPMVDAGMRQLAQQQWMSNRSRMVAASFLTKHLLIDWRWGEQFFMRHLIDGDLASNNGGWQWAASTGTDAAPYFRIFNPVLQGVRFDPQGEFVRKWIPELSKQPPGDWIHEIWKHHPTVDGHSLDYPPPLVEHSFGRDRAIKAFSLLASTTTTTTSTNNSSNNNNEKKEKKEKNSIKKVRKQ